MLGKLIALAAVLLLAAPNRSYTAGRFALFVDGESAGFVKSVSGGNVKGEVATHNAGPENFQRKHIANIKHEAPMVLKTGIAMEGQLGTWLKRSLAQPGIRKDLKITAKNFDIDFKQALITEVKFPTLDVTAKDQPLTVELSIAGGPSTVTQRKHKLSKAIKAGQEPTVAAFRFKIDGVKCRVTKIDGFTLKQSIVKKAAVKPAEFKIHVDAACASRLGGSANEKHAAKRGAVLTFVDPVSARPIAKLELARFKVVSMQSSAEGAKTGAARFEVELYVEELTISW